MYLVPLSIYIQYYSYTFLHIHLNIHITRNKYIMRYIRDKNAYSIYIMHIFTNNKHICNIYILKTYKLQCYK